MLSDEELIAEPTAKEEEEVIVEEIVDEEIVDEIVDETIEEEEEDEDSEESYTVRVNGEDLTVDLDELLKGYGTTKAANEKFRDAAYARKQSEEFINLLKNDPWTVLNNPDLGLDTRKMAEEYLVKQLNHDQLTDEQKELLEAKQKLAEYEQSKKDNEQSDYDRQMEELQSQYHAEYTTEINTALEADGLPITESTVRRMAGYMSEALQSEDPAIRALKAADICELVREDYITDFKSMFGSSDAETLEAILGADLALTLRKADVKKLTSRNDKTTKPVKGSSKRAKTESKAMTMEDFDDYLDSF